MLRPKKNKHTFERFLDSVIENYETKKEKISQSKHTNSMQDLIVIRKKVAKYFDQSSLVNG